MANQPVPPDTDYRHAYMAAIIAITVIAVLTAWLRVYTRIYISHNAWWDDWVMFAATVGFDHIFPLYLLYHIRYFKLIANSSYLQSQQTGSSWKPTG